VGSLEIRWAETDKDHYAEVVLSKMHRDSHGGELARFNSEG